MATSIKLDQKRLAHLRQSLYGKDKSSRTKIQSTSGTEIDNTNLKTLHRTTASSIAAESFVSRDLMKVVFLSALAICLQLLVHAALVNKWIHINFYGITY